MKKELLSTLDVMTSIIVGEKIINEEKHNLSLPILLFDAENQQNISAKDYEIWYSNVKAIVLLMREIDANLKQLGGHKSTKAGKLFNNINK